MGGAQFVGALPPAEAPEILVLLGASLLVFRTFRHRYLLPWMLGWLAYLIYRGPQWLLPSNLGLGWAPAVAFIAAVFLFSAAILLYTNSQFLLLPAAIAATMGIAMAVLRDIFWPHSPLVLWALEGTFRVCILFALVRLIRQSWGSWRIGPWLLCASLPLLHLEPGIAKGHLFSGLDFAIESVFCLGMLLIVLDESKIRTRQLGVVNALAAAITQAPNQQAMLEMALQQLKQLTGASAAWFRFLKGNRTIIAGRLGVAPEFLKNRQHWEHDRALATLVARSTPALLKTSDLDPATRDHFQRDGMRYVVAIPVKGKTSVIGLLALSYRRQTAHLTEELDFLGATANQLGIAVENLALLELILRSQREWVSTFDSIEDCILVHDSEYRIMKANRALLTRLGRSPLEVVESTCDQVLPHDRTEWQGCPYCTHITAEFAEGADPCFGGSSLVSTSSYVWTPSYSDDDRQKELGTIHIVRDTTEYRAAEQKYRLLFEQVHEGVFVADRHGKLLDCNNALVTMLGYAQRDDLLALNADALYASLEQRGKLLRQIETHNHVRSFEVQLRKRDGSTLAAVETSFATRNAAGEIERYQGFLLDVTEKKRAEDEIRRRNRELHVLNAIAVIATQSFDLDEILSLTLRQVIHLFNAETGSVYLTEHGSDKLRRRASWGHRTEMGLLHPELILSHESWEAIVRMRVEVLTPKHLTRLPEPVTNFIRAEGLRSWMWAILWGKDEPLGVMGISSREEREFTASDEKLVIAIGRQLATTVDKIRLYEETSRAYEDLCRTQEQLLQSEKMSAIGQLIAGVAHELNNPLTAILGYAQLLENEALGERSRDFVRKLFTQAQRTHRLVQNLLSFARQRKPQKIEVDVPRVLEDTLVLREYDLKRSNIVLEREVAPDLPSVIADPHQLEQVFLNIINNAVDAIQEGEGGGILRVRIYSQEARVCVEFHDSGPGLLDPKRIFDPFYTTKSVGKGTGLGLSICYGIVKEHGGEISAQNSPEGGAVVLVCLPAADKTIQLQQPIISPPRQLALEGRVLLVDDEEGVLEFEREVLAGAGAKVATASSAEEALVLMRAENFDAYILNGSMPNGWTAQRMFDWLAQNRAGSQKHLLFTFAVIDASTQIFLDEKGIQYLIKPFEMGDIIAATRRVLSKVHAASASQ